MAKKTPKADSNFIAPKDKVLAKGELPEGEKIVAMTEYRGMIHIATSRHIYILGGRDRTKLQKMLFTVE
jgi:hypothetical protein